MHIPVISLILRVGAYLTARDGGAGRPCHYVLNDDIDTSVMDAERIRIMVDGGASRKLFSSLKRRYAAARPLHQVLLLNMKEEDLGC